MMLYIHWPFCKSKCTYCDFVALEGHNRFMEQYHRALCAEIEGYCAERDEKRRGLFLCPVCPVSNQGASVQNRAQEQEITSIYIGGGTPSTYPLDLLEELFELLHKKFTIAPEAEITLEVNPGGQTEAHFKTWKKVGINRLSVGVQVLDETVLAKLRRFQSNADVEAFYEKAPLYITNLSADLIIGLPGVTDQVWEQTLERLRAWNTCHVSLYFLMVHKNTPLYHGVKRGDIVLPDDDMIVEQYKKTRDILERAGFVQYELSNFAQPGCESRHNQGYWNRTPYKGFGIGASSFDGHCRFSNEKNLTKYINLWGAPGGEYKKNINFHERLTDVQVQTEEIMLSLRTADGIDFDQMISPLQESVRQQIDLLIEKLCEQGDVTVNGSRVVLTRQGMRKEHEIARILTQELA